jgi:catechol 2,3-dioxygenase-like lactoylglutathione lyase family enzyme
VSQHHTHSDLHAEQGGLPGEHAGRAQNPVIKVRDIAWLEFEKPDLVAAERFAAVFGFSTSLRTESEFHLRGTFAGSPAVIIRRGPRSRFIGPAFHADSDGDVLRIAERLGTSVGRLPEAIGGVTVDAYEPSGLRVRVVSGTHMLPALPDQVPHTFNTGADVVRTNGTQRPPAEPARVQRLGHVVLQTNRYRESLDWYLENLGMIVSDFQYFEGQRELGPTMSFIRCDRGSEPADHHTLAMTLGPSNRYVHSAYQVNDVDALAAGGEVLLHAGYTRSWGIGRHIQGSQIFDYWRDPDGFMVEHFTDGDMFDNTLEPGWAPMTASGLAQWGPRVTKDFLGIKPGKDSLAEARAVLTALRRNDTEFTPTRLKGLLKVARS